MAKIKNSSKKSLIAGLLVLLVVAVAAGILLRKHHNDSRPTAPVAGTPDKINLEPATAEDKQRDDQNKQDIVNRDQQLQAQPPQTGKKTVKPIITYAGQYGTQVEVGGYVPGVFEDGGTCTATFTSGTTSFSKSVTAVKNVNSNDCPVMIAKNEEFSSKGTWLVVVSYNSATANGGSDSKSFEIK